MKIKLLLSSTLFLAFNAVVAQYCGISGFNFIPDTSITELGTFDSEGVPCIIQGQVTDVLLHFKTDKYFIDPQGGQYTFDYMGFDTIEGLPSGLCWSSSNSNNRFQDQQQGCLRFTGITNAPAGQYTLRVVARIHIYFGLYTTVFSDSLIDIKLRVVSLGDTCAHIDTTITNSPVDTGGVLSGLALIKGKVYYDDNLNGIYDSTEIGIPNEWVNVGNNYAYTNMTGDYFAYVNMNSYTVKPVLTGSAAIFTFTPDSISINVDTIGKIYVGNFGVTIPAGYCQGRISVYNKNMYPRPGFYHDVRVKFFNDLSADPSSQDVRYYYDSLIRYVAAVPAPSVVDTVNRYIQWNTGSISKGNSWLATVQMYTPSNIAMGEVTTYIAEVLNATCGGFDTLRHVNETEVKASFDPNDKDVSPVGYGTHRGVNPDLNPVFSYKVRFQNTGNFYAENITIVDTVSQYLDLSTIKVLDASHSYEVTVDGRAIKFWFKQIMLPDSNSNEPESHGYILYTINPYAGLAQDVLITNRADIYFDFNEAILTNTTLTTIDYTDYTTVGIEDIQNNNFIVFPNPAKATVTILTDNNNANQQITVTDISGRQLIQTMAKHQTLLDISDLSKGMYFVQVGNTTKKLLLE